MVAASLAWIVACSGSPKPPPGGGGGGGGSGSGSEPTADACEPGRCLADLAAAVEAKHADAVVCYDAARKKDAKVTGRVVINFRIDPDGKVIDTSQGAQSGQVEDPQLVECLSGVIREVQFAASKKHSTTRAYHRFEL